MSEENSNAAAEAMPNAQQPEGKLADATDGAAQMTDERLIKEFGCGEIDEAMLARWEKVTGRKPHMFMRRGLYFAHRELNQILDAKEANKPIYIYTGRGPSSDALHLGHLCPFILCKYIQEALDCYFIIQVTDDEKYMREKDISWETIQEYTESNIRDIIAQGFNPEKTFIMRQSKWFNINVSFLSELSRVMSLHIIKTIFGFTDEHSVGYVVFPAKQIAPAFSQNFPQLFTNPKDVVCLIPCGREQDPYFRYARELAKRLKLKRVSTMYGRFIPALQGDKKMTASTQSSAIYLTDSPETIAEKINLYAKTSFEEGGSDLETDVVFKYLCAFDDDDEYIEEVRRRYGKDGQLKEGETRMTVEEVKERLIKILQGILIDHQTRKAAITPELVSHYEEAKKWN